MKLGTLVVAAIAAGAMTLTTIAPSAAAPLAPAHLQGQPSSVAHVQYRHWHGGPRHGYHGGYRGGYYGHRHHGRGNAGAVIGGLAAGAIIGGAIANSRAQASESQVSCAQRYRSYDPASGTYLGKDGRRHVCR